MFGGWGIYLDGRFMAILAGDTLYLKADAVNRPVQMAAGGEPFRPWPDRPTELSYCSVPRAVLDDPPLFLEWAEAALAAARRAASKAPAPIRGGR
ncbi:MAG: hypothetical protein OHK0024_16110 [Thalassobaculales bacterium]